MTKLEILSMYLPYWIKLQLKNTPKAIWDLMYIHKLGECAVFNGAYKSLIAQKEDIKPILYPLDLTQKIWFEGKEIVPIVELNVLFGDFVTYFECMAKKRIIENTADSELSTPFIHKYENPNSYPFAFIQQLLKWRINLWLKEGEYIPVTNEFNPYKTK